MTTHNAALLRARGKADIALAARGLGRYGWGDEGQVRHGIEYNDCSGMIYDDFNDCGYHIIRSTADGYSHMTRPISGKPGCGDVALFDHDGNGTMDHIVLCIGASECIEARTAHAAITNQWQAHPVSEVQSRAGFRGWRRFPEPWRFPIIAPKPAPVPVPSPPVVKFPRTYVWNGAAFRLRAEVDAWLRSFNVRGNLMAHKGLLLRVGVILTPTLTATNLTKAGKKRGLTMHSAPTTDATQAEVNAFIAKL